MPQKVIMIKSYSDPNKSIPNVAVFWRWQHEFIILIVLIVFPVSCYGGGAWGDFGRMVV